MATKKFSELTVLDTVNANLELTVLPVYDTSSGTTRKVTLQQLNDSIEANIPFAAAAFTQANIASNTATTADQKALSAGNYANSAFSRANNSLNVNTGGTITGDISITGNLSLTGCTATLSVSTLRTSDHVIDVGHGTTGVPSQNAGIRVLRGDESAVQIRWNESTDKWQYTNDGTSYSDITSVDSNRLDAAFQLANTTNVTVQSVYDYANTIVFEDVWARDSANSASSYSNSSYSQANTANTLAQAAFDAANTTAFTSTPTLDNLSLNGLVYEKFETKQDATGVVNHDCANASIFYHTSPDSNFTVNLQNLGLLSGRATSITLVIAQGATAYIANTVQIAGDSQTIKWSANTEPTGNANAVDIQSFSIFNNSGTYTVLGQLSTFG